MIECEECGNELGILQGYHHPALGKGFLVCGKCYDKVEEDMKRWSEFCLSDSFNAEASRIDIQGAWNRSISKDPQLQKWFNNLWIKIESRVLEE